MNKRETCVVATHSPTGFEETCSDERTQERNKALAIERLRIRVEKFEETNSMNRTLPFDKIRTIRLQADIVKCEVTGRTIKASRYLNGELFSSSS